MGQVIREVITFKDLAKLGGGYLVYLSLVFSLVVLVVASFLGVFSQYDMRILWLLLYGASAILIIKKVKTGFFFDPLVVVPGAYLFLVVTGTILFGKLTGIGYAIYPSNLVGLGYVSLILGIFLTRDFNHGVNRATENSWPRAMKNRPLMAFLFMICLLLSLALFASGGIPILAEDVNEAKLSLFSGRGYLGVFFRGLGIISLAVLHDACITRWRTRLRISHTLAVLVTFFILITGQRSSTLIFLGEYLSMYFLFNRRRFSFTEIVKVTVLVVLFLGAMGSYRHQELDFEPIISEVGHILLIRPKNFELITERYDKLRFYHGKLYFHNLKKLLPGKQEGLGTDLKNELFPHRSDMPELAGVSVTIIGEAYMNFGEAGVIGVMIALGMVLSLAYKKMISNPTFMRSAFYLTLVFAMAGAVSSGISNKIVHLIFFWFWIAIVGLIYERKAAIC